MTHTPTNETIARISGMAAVGVHQEDMCAFLGISEKTLRKHYGASMSLVKGIKIQEAASLLYKIAMEGNLSALIFWLKTQGRFRENEKQEITLPVEQITKIEVEMISPAEEAK